MARNPARFAAGLLIWASLAGGLASLAFARSCELRPPAERVLRYALHRPERTLVRLQPAKDGQQPGVGDPVLAGDERTFIGAVEKIDEDLAAVGTRTWVARIVLDPEYDPADLEGAACRFETAPDGFDFPWVYATLLPPAKRETVKKRLSAYAAAHSKEIGDVLRPIGEQAVEHAWNVFDANIAASVERHKPEINALIDKYHGTLKDELLPVLKEELGPSAKEKAKPILVKIGRECWDALPMWSGSWALIRQKLPFQKKDYVDEWWQEFLETRAIPILKEHEDELVKAGEDLVREGFKDPKVRAAVSETLRKIVHDPEFKKLLRVILEEALVRPFDPGTLIEKVVNDEQNQEHFAALRKSLSPVLQEIGQEIAVEKRADGRDGLSPELTRVLRRIVLKKDARWVAVAPTRPLKPRTLASGGGL